MDLVGGKVKREIVRMGFELEMLLDEAEHGHLGSSQTQFRLHFRFRRNIAGLFQPEWQQGRGSASKLDN